MTFLTGKKTYIVATVGVLYAIFGYFYGALTPSAAVQVVLAALAVAGLRNGLTNEIAGVVSSLLPTKTPPSAQPPATG